MGFMREQIRYRKYERGFTLIELMATLVILALIIAIAVPAIGKLVAQADSSADKSSIALMERAGEMAYIDDLKTDDAAPKNSKLPGSITEKDVYMIPTLIEKGYLKLDDASKFNKPENYVKKVNKSGKFIYMGKGKDDGDKPSNEDVAMGSCARDFAYNPKAISSEDDYKMVMRDGHGYDAITMDNNGNYVAVGTFSRYSYVDDELGIMMDRYDKDLKLIDSKTSFADTKGATNRFGFAIYDVLSNKAGGFVVLSQAGVSLYDSNLTHVKTEPLSDHSPDSGLRIVEAPNGTYFVASGADKNGYVVEKFSADLSPLASVVIPSSTGKESMNTWAVLNDFDVLASGDLLIAGSGVYNEKDTGHLIRFTQDFDVVASTDKTEPHFMYGYAQAEELANGSIVVLYKGDYSDGTAGIRLFDKNLTMTKSVEHVDAGYGGYQSSIRMSDWFLNAEGNTISTISNERFITYDAGLSVTKEQSVQESLLSAMMRYKVAVVDNGSFVLSGGPGSNDMSMMVKVMHVFEGEGSGQQEMAPMISPTNPPSKYKYADPNGNGRTPYDDGNPTPWLPSEDSSKDEEQWAIPTYASGYNEKTKKVNTIYAGSVMMKLPTGSGQPTPYEVAADGALVELTMTEFMSKMQPLIDKDTNILTIPMYLFVDGFKGLQHDDQSIAPPADLPLYVVGDGGSESPGGTAPSVDPCYAGAFIVNVYDMLMYRVQEDGSLKLLGDPYKLSESELGFDAKKDVVLYLFKDGQLRVYPPFYYQTQG